MCLLSLCIVSLLLLLWLWGGCGGEILIPCCRWTPGGSKREEIFQRPEEPKDNSWKKYALRRRDSVNSEFIDFRWIQEGTSVFVFCVRISSSLSKIFMLSITINNLVVELWRKDSNWRLVARKPMEIMVGVQYAKIERWLGTPLSKPSFSLFIKASLFLRNFKIMFPYSKIYLLTYLLKFTRLENNLFLFSFQLLGFTILFVKNLIF